MRAFEQGETIILNRKVPKTGPDRYDAYGVLQYDVVSTTVVGVAMWPTTNTETRDGDQHRTSLTYVIGYPDTVSMDAVDFITWRGKSWLLRGEPEKYRHPITGNGLYTVQVNRTEG